MQDKMNELIFAGKEDASEYTYGQPLLDFQEWYGSVCEMCDLVVVGWVELTQSGKDVINKAYDSWKEMLDVPDYQFGYDFPFNDFKKPEAVVYV